MLASPPNKKPFERMSRAAIREDRSYD
ncbi:hypothetical protein MPL3356_40264 [Mesorhizobium plurifarium]|uniref:Uncharacterized protein n=1 Tax=Mesorhizobium plurifarium TaxID=69974 RepID=A0A090GD46_MESPL|nr:hypothetical protein MPL3356_40264 [Mesorhizobium plurifarium]CDX57738.1 hypothetical protein MPL3365_280012 [Mesorhizobium plurifarium]